MCSFNAIERRRSMYRRARHFYITRPWGMNIGPFTLSRLLETAGSATSQSTSVAVGCRITLFDFQENDVCEMDIVSPQESQPSTGKISFLSPLGAALLNKRIDDTVKIPVPGGAMKFKIIRITPC